MKYAKTKIATAIALTVAASGAQAIPTVMTVTAGVFKMDHHTSPPQGVPFVLSFGTGAADITDQYNPAGWDISIPQPTGVAAPGAIATWTWGTGPTDQVNTFTAPSGGPVPVFNGILENGNVSSIDMTSFFMNFSGTTLAQGNVATNLALSNCVGSRCDWSMSWISTAIIPMYSPHHGTWELSGTIAAVPETSTYGMMLAGLGLVGLATRRRRNSKAEAAPRKRRPYPSGDPVAIVAPAAP